MICVLAACYAIGSLAQAVAGPQGNNNTAVASSIFVSGNNDIAFALNVPNNSATDLYFSILLPSQRAWGAIGLGSNQMAGALMLVVYSAKDGQNVTVSPRLATGHTEPSFTPDINIQTLPGTGLFNGSAYLFNGKCTNCRSWSSGSGGKNRTIDVKSKEQSFLYAAGPASRNVIKSDDKNAGLKMHSSYGTFTMDMLRATGPAGVPVISQDGKNPGRVGTEQRLQVKGKSDRAATAHAIIMIFVFVGLFPFGTLVLRLGNWVRWHAINQGFGGLLVIIGFGLGAHISKLYNRVSASLFRFKWLLTNIRRSPRTSTALTRSSAFSSLFSFWASSPWASSTIAYTRRRRSLKRSDRLRWAPFTSGSVD